MHLREHRLDTRNMRDVGSGPCSPPRVIVAGQGRGPLASTDGFAEALARHMPVRTIDAPATARGLLRLVREGSSAVHSGGFEAVHVQDLRLAPAAFFLRGRFGIPVSSVVSEADLPRRRPSLAFRWLRRMDHVWTSGATAATIARRAPGTAMSVAQRVAVAVEPAPRDLTRFASMLGDVTPGRLTIGIPWPEDRQQARWLRDAVVPLLHGRPVVLWLGAPSRREARLLTGAMGLQTTHRVHIGVLSARTLAAAARCADAFIVPGAAKSAPDLDGLLLTLVASGVPVVAAAGVRSDVLVHERNMFVADPQDAMSVVALLNKLLALPAVQRHYLGEEFAAYTLHRWSWDDAIEGYAERFAALVGRPQIPAELRAA